MSKYRLQIYYKNRNKQIVFYYKQVLPNVIKTKMTVM